MPNDPNMPAGSATAAPPSPGFDESLGTRRDAMGNAVQKNQALASPGAIEGAGDYVYRPNPDQSITILHDPTGAATGVDIDSGPAYEAIQAELAARAPREEPNLGESPVEPGVDAPVRPRDDVPLGVSMAPADPGVAATPPAPLAEPPAEEAPRRPSNAGGYGSTFRPGDEVPPDADIGSGGSGTEIRDTATSPADERQNMAAEMESKRLDASNRLRMAEGEANTIADTGEAEMARVDASNEARAATAQADIAAERAQTTDEVAGMQGEAEATPEDTSADTGAPPEQDAMAASQAALDLPDDDPRKIKAMEEAMRAYLGSR